jgi:adenylate cyclase
VQRLDDMSYDVQLRTGLTKPKNKDSAVVIVDIDDKSLKEQGRWPWPRNKLADLITKIQNLGAVVIALDITFPEPEPNMAASVLAKLPANTAATDLLQKLLPDFDYDQMLAQSFQRGDTILGMTFHDFPNTVTGAPLTPIMTLKPSEARLLSLPSMEGYTNNIPLLNRAAKSTGFINAFADSDGIIRHSTLLMRYKNGIYPSLALEAARDYLLSDIKLDLFQTDNLIVINAIQLGKQIIPTDIGGRVLIPFRGPAGSFPYISATDILNNKLAAGALTNKLVFLGTSAFGLGDLQTTAVGTAYPGVEIHANIAEGILTNHFPYQPTWLLGAQLVFIIILGLLLTVLFAFLSARWLVFFAITIPILFIMTNSWIFDKTAIVVSTAIPIALTISLAAINMGLGYLLESRRRGHLKNIFGQYLAPAYIEELLKHSNKSSSLAGESREMTVLFSDIRNFTTLSEKMAAAEIKTALNLFFTPMTKIIFDCHGTIDKYVGDMIMAFWGAPLVDPDHAKHAITAALAMQTKVKELRPIFIERGLPELNIGIGLNTGLMNVGDMGSEFRRAYTVIGDTVNLASRLEALTKYYGVGIIVGEQTQANQPDFIFRKLDYVRVKGKEVAVTIYEPLCTRQEATPELLKEVALYEQALSCYFNRQWQMAIDLFKSLVEKYPQSRLYSIYLERCLDPARQNEDLILPTIFTEK